MCRFAVPSLICGFLLVAIEAAEAQLVRIGPGGAVRVRAPFVRVEVGPNGGTYVRAPFTSVYTPGYRTRFRTYEYGVLPAGEVNVEQMGWRQLRQYTRVATNDLENELAQMDGGSAWIAVLRPGTIRDLIAEDSDQPPDQATADQLQEILRNYADGVPDRLTRLGGFRAVRQAIGELVLPPRQRQQRNLATQWTILSRDLSRFETGQSWQTYLELPVEAMASDHDSQKPDTEHLKEMLSRYEQVAGTAEYRQIAGLASFEATRQLLASYVDLLQTAADAEPAPEREELPPPLP